MTTKRRNNYDKASDFATIQEDPYVGLDAMRLLCGSKIGEGQFRAVYECNIIKGAVVKIAGTAAGTRANMMEFEVWESVMTSPHKKWFAPVLWISPSGHFLIQKKCRRITMKDKLPKVLPDMFEDIKKSNWGFIGKQLVCHDYQFIMRAIDCAMITKRSVTWK